MFPLFLPDETSITHFKDNLYLALDIDHDINALNGSSKRNLKKLKGVIVIRSQISWDLNDVSLNNESLTTLSRK